MSSFSDNLPPYKLPIFENWKVSHTHLSKGVKARRTINQAREKGGPKGAFFGLADIASWMNPIA